MADKKKSHFIGLRISEDEYSSILELAKELSRMYPCSEEFGCSQVIRWCIRSASDKLLR